MENETPVMDCLEEQNNSIDRLEDEIIDHPSSASGTCQFSDESFQHKLNERANQIQQGSEWSSSDPNDPYPDQSSNSASYQFLYTKPNLVYKYSDHGNLTEELDQWFVSSDFALIGLDALKNKQLQSIDLENPPAFLSLDLGQPSPWLDSLLYFALGTYGDVFNESDQITKISQNCNKLVSSQSFSTITNLLSRAFDRNSDIINQTSSGSFTKGYLTNYFKIMTIVYFGLNVALISKVFPENLISVLIDADLLSKIVKLSEVWKTTPNPNLRIRNCLLLHWKLMLVEFGNSEHLSLADEYLVKRYDVKNKDRRNKKSKELTCSRVDYFTFEEDLHDKYPMKREAPDETPDKFNWNENDDTSSLSTLLSDRLSLSQEKEIFMATNLHSSSLSNLIEIPRTNKSHSIYGSLPGNTVHIATPVPSPPKTPSEFMSGGEKVRRSYHVNQGLPFIYPFEGRHVIPEAISEASQLIEKGIYESYSDKRISRERDIFLAKERGNKEENSVSEDPKGSQKDTLDGNSNKYQSVTLSLERVEIYYQKILKHLRGFVDVLMSVLKTSKVEISLRDLERELDPESSFSDRFGNQDHTDNKIFGMIYHQLDILRAKETTLKAISAILILTLRWFKLSHPLKAYYFSSLLFDARYPGVFVDFLSDSFNNSALQNFASENKGMQLYDVLSSQNRLLNPSICPSQLSFFRYCQRKPDFCAQKYELVNKVPIGKLPHKLDDANKSVINITKFNHDFCFILINLLNVTNKVLIKNISQRIFVFNETKPTDLLKIILLNYVNEDLREPILKIFKKITPYQGRKWRALNMDVISLIFLHMKLSLRDNWLSGKDLENEFKDSLDQEISLRSLLQFYNSRNYPEEMKSLGYTSLPFSH
ncbi:hypothetical protein JCM33374_g5848 [Metschnikowia sp. JCM 33374]|nr:hypothetical protein JCM33374_g5848 [Metschnikowia sp. JCM 33374]